MDDPLNLTNQIARTYPNDHMKLSSFEWLVNADLPIVEFSESIGIERGTRGTVMIIAAAAYYGLQSIQVWDWIQKKWEGGPHGRDT